MTSTITGARDAIPLYHQIFLTLRDEILSGTRPFGATVPTEHELSLQHGVSRITARRALSELAQNGLVERKQRIGTRVVFRTPEAPIEGQIDQAVDALIAFGRDTEARVLEFGPIEADALVAERLEVPLGSMITRALRLRLTEGAPLGAIESFVPLDVGARLSRAALEDRPILELIRESGFEMASGSQSISAGHADPALAALLEAEPRIAILRVDRVVRGGEGRPILFTRARYRGDRYRLNLDLHGSALPISARISSGP